MVSFLTPVVGGLPLRPFSFSFLQTATSTTNSTSYSFSSQNLGAADANREIFAVFTCRVSSGGPPTNPSVSINGVSATVYSAVTANARIVLAHALVPTGTSGTVTLSFGGTSTTFLSCTCSLFRVIRNRTGTGPLSFDTDAASISGAASSCALSYDHRQQSFTISAYLANARTSSGLGGFSGSGSDTSTIETGFYTVFWSVLNVNAAGTQTQTFSGSDSGWAGGLWTFSR
jgi:hypothetical protein